MKHRLHYVGVLCEGKTIYVGVPDRAKFDKIALEETDHRVGNGEKKDLLTKADFDGAVHVIFQHWLSDEPGGEV